MYIKQVVKKNKNSNKKYTYLHLVENIRTPSGPRQRLIINLGDIPIRKDKYKELANCIESLLTGQTELFSPNKKVNEYAREAAAKIRKKQSRTLSLPQNKEILPADIRSIDINSLESSEIRTIGPEYVCHKMWQSLDIDSCLLKAGVSVHVLPLLQSLVIGRAVSPGSELHTKGWSDYRSAIYELTGSPLRDSLNSYYRGGDILFQNKDALEKHLCAQERDLFSLPEKICFFDLSNSHFEGVMGNNPKAKFGRSKQKRNDCRLLTLALIIDEDGFIKHSKLYPGNQYEAHTLETMLTELEELNPMRSSQADKPTIVMDAGIANSDNISYLQKSGFHYVVVNKGKTPFVESDLNSMIPIRVDKDGNPEISVKRYNDNENDEVFILCKSNRREMKENGIFSRQEQLFIEQLEYTLSGIGKKGHTKKYAKIIERIGRLKEKYPKASKQYTITVVPNTKEDIKIENMNVVDIVWSKKEHNQQDARQIHGCYVLRSDRIDLRDDEIWSIYVMLTNIERTFRNMKSSLGLRPNFHQKEDRADAHMFISVLTYHLIHIIEYKLRKKGDTRSWETIRKILSTHCRLTIECREVENNKVKGKVFVRLCSKPEEAHIDIYKKLKLPSNPKQKLYYENL